jgi:hypothetical protein
MSRLDWTHTPEHAETAAKLSELGWFPSSHYPDGVIRWNRGEFHVFSRQNGTISRPVTNDTFIAEIELEDAGLKIKRN